MKLVITNRVFISDVTQEIEYKIMQRLKIPNPKWIENNRMGRWNKEVPEFLKFYTKIGDKKFIVPRGFTRQLILLCKHYKVPYEIDDKRRVLDEKEFTFYGQLKPFQEEAVNILLKKEFGTLSAPTASGKTVMALYMIAKRKQPALIIVHNKELAFQWIDRIEEFLKISIFSHFSNQ